MIFATDRKWMELKESESFFDEECLGKSLKTMVLPPYTYLSIEADSLLYLKNIPVGIF